MEFFHLVVGDGPLVAAAIHNGHALRREVAERIALEERDRLREEDPFTNILADVAPTQITGARSRFEVDLNRPREQAVYRTPDDCCGLDVWREPLPAGVVRRSLASYDLFHATVKTLLQQMVALYGRVIVLDIHTYNHRRNGASAPTADEGDNPEVNVGTASMDRGRWAPIIDGLIEGLSSFDYHGRRLDVRENVKFRGGDFSQWIHREFPETVCAPAIEFRKSFMDEWTGDVDHHLLVKLRDALRATVPQLLEQLQYLS